MKAVCFAAAGLLPATHRCLINKHTLRGDMCVHKAGNTSDVSTFTVRRKTGSAAEGRNKQTFSVSDVRAGTCSTHGDVTNYSVKVCDNSRFIIRISCWMFPIIWDVLAKAAFRDQDVTGETGTFCFNQNRRNISSERMEHTFLKKPEGRGFDSR
jgi:hypothetical protein